MTFFESIKQSVSIPQVAACYGMTVDRSGKCCCLFHQDKHPSMKLNEDYYYCFSCHATDDVISLTARLFGLTTKDAALKLASDFGLTPNAALQQLSAEKVLRRSAHDERERVIHLLNEIISTLRWWKEAYAPKHPRKKMSDEFVTACQCLECFQHLADMLSYGYPDNAALATKYIEAKNLIPTLEEALKVKQCLN